MIDLDKLGTGSVVESSTGELFTTDCYGDWWKLSISLGSSPVKNLDYLKEGTILREVEKGPLDGFEVGDLVYFESEYGSRVALMHREDFWTITGWAGERSSSEMVEVFSPELVRKVGSLDGGS